MDEKTRSILKDVFGEATTQQVLTTPTEMDGKRAEVLIEAMPIDLLLRDLGIVAARQVAEVISMAGLRPADFAGIPDIPQALVAKLVEALVMGDDRFFGAFAAQLAARG